jgi:hypothetical protein
LNQQYTQSLKSGKEKEEMKECSFEPKIDKISKAVIPDGEFYKRQLNLLQKKVFFFFINFSIFLMVY